MEENRTDLINRCRKHLQLCKRFGWDKEDPNELRQARDMLKLGLLLKEEKEFHCHTEYGSWVTIVGCDASIYWVLTMEQLDQLEKDYGPDIPYKRPTYGHFVNEAT